MNTYYPIPSHPIFGGAAATINMVSYYLQFFFVLFNIIVTDSNYYCIIHILYGIQLNINFKRYTNL